MKMMVMTTMVVTTLMMVMQMMTTMKMLTMMVIVAMMTPGEPTTTAVEFVVVVIVVVVTRGVAAVVGVCVVAVVVGVAYSSPSPSSRPTRSAPGRNRWMTGAHPSATIATWTDAIAGMGGARTAAVAGIALMETYARLGSRAVVLLSPLCLRSRQPVQSKPENNKVTMTRRAPRTSMALQSTLTMKTEAWPSPSRPATLRMPLNHLVRRSLGQNCKVLQA